MPFIRRDADGKIEALFATARPDARESLPLDHPEVRAFLAPEGEERARDLLDDSDRDLIRVVEDLITLLAERNLIRLTDLPPEARQKLLFRKDLRQRLRERERTSLVDDDGLI